MKDESHLIESSLSQIKRSWNVEQLSAFLMFSPAISLPICVPPSPAVLTDTLTILSLTFVLKFVFKSF